ncbi:MAG: hypothetical protein P8J18_05430, partial [Halieaceae bacterium]|nr:hypothetical protein [Halieaceae bacterium]
RERYNSHLTQSWSGRYSCLRQAFGLSLEDAGRATNFDYGGYKTVSAKDTVSRLIKVINNLDIFHSGSFINYTGTEIPWYGYSRSESSSSSINFCRS